MTRPYPVSRRSLLSSLLAAAPAAISKGDQREGTPQSWPSQPPPGCPFSRSRQIAGLAFTGRHSDYRLADTWYPSWASDGRLYSPWTDGTCPRLDGSIERSDSSRGPRAQTGQAVLEGEDPLSLRIYSLGLVEADASPYLGRYPCGSLVHNGVWYYGTYTLGPLPKTRYGDMDYNWPWLGPCVGFRTSTDFGRTWKETPHTAGQSLFGETGMWGHPVKIGSPHFVDFGRNMEHSPDGKAYLVAHGAPLDDPQPRFANLSWISGDEIYLIRVVPSVENINNPRAYEFYAGIDTAGKPVWTGDFAKIRPLIEWNNNCGCVTATYIAPLRKYLMCVTDGWPTVARMNSYVLEADAITGPWRLVHYLKDFGQQAYFLNFPSKFVSADGRTAWLCYSANFARDWNGMKIEANPPGSRYGLVLQELRLLA